MLYDIAWLSFCRPWTLGMEDVDIKAAALRFFLKPMLMCRTLTIVFAVTKYT
jgi:hypothetical protein